MRILTIGSILVLFGLLAIYSVSIHESFGLTLKLVESGGLDEPSNYFYFLRQLRNLFAGIILAGLTRFLPLKRFKKPGFAILVFGVFFAFQLLVFSPLGIALNGAKGWLNISGLGTVQPSEFFKLGFIIFMTQRIYRKKENIKTQEFFISFMVIVGACLAIFLFIPDLGTVLVLGLVAMLMVRYAGARPKFILGLMGGGIVLGLLVGLQFDYIKNRLFYFLDSTVDPNNRGIGRQTQQALISVGGGGLRGKGYGKGLQKFGFIPEAQSDFVFAAFSEEVGMLGNLFLIGLYLALAFSFLHSLQNNKDQEIKLLGIGIIGVIMIQAFVNIGVNLRILPNTGLTLPFVSFGGTALMVNLIELVLLIKISEFSEKTGMTKSLKK